jgi:hypothetical protein
VMLGCMRVFGNLAVVANSRYTSMKSPMLCAVIAPPKQRCTKMNRAAPSSLRLGAASWRLMARPLVEERELLDGREWVSWVADGNHMLIKVID